MTDEQQPRVTPERDAASESASAPKTGGGATTAVAALVALLVGFGGGYLVGQATAPTPEAAPDQAPSAPAPSTPADTAAPTPAPSETPTLSEEQKQQIIEARRAVPRRDADDPLAIGEVDAPVVLVEFFDYQCSYCGKWTLETQPALMQLVEDGTLRIEFRDFPIFGEMSASAAAAATAAAQQDKYLEYHEALFTYQFVDGNKLTEDSFAEIAAQVGIPDMEAFTATLEDPEVAAQVQSAGQEAMQTLGTGSTPQFVINDEYIGGAAPTEQFLAVIESELAKVQN